MQLNTTPVAFARRPFDSDPWRATIPEGKTVAEIVASVPDHLMPVDFWERGVVCINGLEVPRECWLSCKPKPNTGDRPISVTMHLAPRGGSKSGGGGKGKGKGILQIIAAIAIVAIATFISAGGLTVLAPGIFSAGLFGAGTIGAALAAAAVSTLGMLALNALTPTPSVEAETFSDRTRQDRNSFSDGNVLAPGGIIPRVIGSHKVFPPLVASPLVDVVDDNEIIEAVYALAGPHEITDIRVDGVDINEMDDTEYQVREGWSDDIDINLVSRYGIVESPQIELTQHILDEDVKRRFKHPTTPQVDLPVWHGIIVASEPDEIWIQIICPQGLYHQTDDDMRIAVPIRMRIRPEGSVSWINLPEAHLVNKISTGFRKMMRIKFVAGSGSVPSPPAAPGLYGWLAAFRTSPPQTTNNPGGAASFGGWVPDTHFNSGSGDFNTPLNTHIAVDDITYYAYGATFETTRRWEIQMMRGNAFDWSQFTPTTFVYAGLGTDVHDHFLYKLSDGTPTDTIAGDPIVPFDQDSVISTSAVVRASSVYNEIPVRRRASEQAAGLALLVIKGRNKSLSKVSVQAAAYVPDWDGTEWANYTTTRFPAAHFRDILTGDLNYDATPTSIIDNENLVEWRQYCIDKDLTCDLIAEGRSVAELLTTLCACGHAKPRFSDLLGVMIDSPRQNDSPVQIFSPRNSNGFRFDIPFAKKPDAYIVSYKNEDVGYTDDQVIVYDPESSPETADKFESITMEGIVEQSKVVARMEFDIGQIRYRQATYAIETDIESLVCRRGDLIGLSHDVIQPRAGFARVRDILVSGPNVTGVTVDSKLQLSTGTDFFADTNIFTEPDIFLMGTEFSAAIRLSDGSVITKALSSSGLTDSLTFATPFTTPAALIEDCLVVVGEVDQEYGRFLVKELIPNNDLTARLILVREAPELHPYYEEDFSSFSIASGLPTGFTNRFVVANMTYSVQAVVVSPAAGTKELKLTQTANARYMASWDVVSNVYKDLELVVGLYALDAVPASGANQAGMALRASGGPATEQGYSFCLHANGTQLLIEKHVAGTGTTVATGEFVWWPFIRYRLKASAVGSLLKMKAWQYVESTSDFIVGYYADYRNSQQRSWTVSQITATPGSTGLQLAASGTDPIFRSGTVSIAGTSNRIIRLDIERLTDRTGGSWQGTVQFITGSHSESASFYKSFSEILLASGRQTIDIDMTTLTVGGSDWIDSTITGLRFDFDDGHASGSFRVYSVSVGHYATAAELVEPADWQITIEDESIAGPGWVGPRTSNGDGDPAYDFISVQALEVIKTVE